MISEIYFKIPWVRTEVEWGIEQDGLNKIDGLKLLIVKAVWDVHGSSLCYPLYFLYVWNFQQTFKNRKSLH